MTRCEFWKQCQDHYGIPGKHQPCRFEINDSLESCPHWWDGDFEEDDMLADEERDRIDERARMIRDALEWWHVLQYVIAPAAR